MCGFPQRSPGEPFPPNPCQRFPLAGSVCPELARPSWAACVAWSSVSCLAFSGHRSHRSRFCSGGRSIGPQPGSELQPGACSRPGCVAPDNCGRTGRAVITIQADDAIPSRGGAGELKRKQRKNVWFFRVLKSRGKKKKQPSKVVRVAELNYGGWGRMINNPPAFLHRSHYSLQT